MARTPKPWFWKPRKTWVVNIRGERHFLGPNKREALREFHRLMEREHDPEAEDCKRVAPHSIPVIIDAFLEAMKIERSPDTFEWYRYRCERFCRFLEQEYPGIRVADLKPWHVQNWVNTYPDFRRTTRRNYLRSVKRPLKWATKQGYIDRNPLEHLEIPAADRREIVITPSEYQQILSLIPDGGLRELIETSWDTGCRPQESLRVCAENFDERNNRWVFKVLESKGERIPRVVYLPDAALHITRKLALKHPDGPLFRNSRGEPWSADSVNCAFDRIQIRMGKKLIERAGSTVSEEAIQAKMKTLKSTRKVRGVVRRKSTRELRSEAKLKLTNSLAKSLATRYSLYAFRHSWATHALERDVDTTTVAILMGHNGDPSMLAKVYAHMQHNPKYLLEQAKKAVARA